MNQISGIQSQRFSDWRVWKWLLLMVVHSGLWTILVGTLHMVIIDFYSFLFSGRWQWNALRKGQLFFELVGRADFNTLCTNSCTPLRTVHLPRDYTYGEIIYTLVPQSWYIFSIPGNNVGLRLLHCWNQDSLYLHHFLNLLI